MFIPHFFNTQVKHVKHNYCSKKKESKTQLYNSKNIYLFHFLLFFYKVFNTLGKKKKKFLNTFQFYFFLL
jgi:hypothetical protein